MSSRPYYSICTATFLSSADFEAFKAKAMTFNSDKAVAYLRENGQTNFSIIQSEESDTTRAVIIWEYESREGREKCQEFWNSWFNYEDTYVAKASFVRGDSVFDWHQQG